jgi:hypothetical protein
MRNKMMMDELIPFSHSQSNKKVCGKMIINIIGADEAFQFKNKKKVCARKCKLHYSNKKKHDQSTAVYHITTQHK